MLLIEQWRDGERIREMVLTDEMIQRSGETTVITFLSHELAGGIVVAIGDELHLREMSDGKS